MEEVEKDILLRMFSFFQEIDARGLKVRFSDEDRVCMLDPMSNRNGKRTVFIGGNLEAEIARAQVLPASNFQACMKKRDCKALLVMVNEHPQLLQEVTEESCTVLHVAVMASSEDLVKKVLEVAFKDGYSTATTLQLLDADDKVYKLKAFEMAAVIGKPNIVIMLEHAVIDCLQGGKPYDLSSYESPLLGPYKDIGDSTAAESCLQHIRDLLQPVLSDLSEGTMSWHEWLQSVNQTDTTPLGNEFVLHATATYGDHHKKTIRCVCEVLGESLLPTLLQLRDQQGRTPLHVAVECASSDDISTFIKELTNRGHGCLDMNVGDFANRTPLHWAAALGKLEAVKALVQDRKALVQDRKTNLNQSFSMGGTGKGAGYHFQGEGVENMTALHLAAFHNHFKVVEVLLNEKNVQANAKCKCKLISGNGAVCNYQYWSPFQIAAAKGHVQTMRVFIKGINEGLHGMKITRSRTSKKELQGGSNCIPELHLAAITSNPLAIKALLTWEEIDPFSLDHNGNTALHYGASAYDLRDAYGACDFVSLPHFTSQPSGKAKTFGGIVGCMDLLMQSGLQMEVQNDQCETPQLGISSPKEVHQWWHEKMIQQTQEIKRKLDDAARSITVTAALVATASFVGPLQPPLGTTSDLGSVAQLDRIGVWEFIVFNSLSFYLAIASIMLAIIPSLPVQHENLLLGVGTFQHRIEAALFLLFCAIVYVVCAFSVSNVAIVTLQTGGATWNGTWDSVNTASEVLGLQAILLVAMGAVICIPAIFAFIGRLLQLTRRAREPWWRTVFVFFVMGIVLALPLQGFIPLQLGLTVVFALMFVLSLWALYASIRLVRRRDYTPWCKLMLVVLASGPAVAIVMLIVYPVVGKGDNFLLQVDSYLWTCSVYGMSPLSLSMIGCWLMWRSQGPFRPKILKFGRHFLLYVASFEGWLPCFKHSDVNN